MTVLQHRPTLRWLAPLVAAVLLGTGASVVGMITASARSGLPDRTAAKLLVDVQKARLDGLSGTIVQNADLGLPSLPGVGGSGSSDMTSLVAGSHTLRLWYAGPNRMRLSLLGSLGESDVVRNGTDVWTWSSAKKTATHRSMPLTNHGAAPLTLASTSPVTPQQAAETALKAISPSTKVSADGTAVVAGRSAYELLLRPRDRASLVGSVRVAIDGKTHVPTRVQVFARNASAPSFEVGFTSFDDSVPPRSVFRFNPPPGTKVSRSSAPPHASAAKQRQSHTAGRAADQAPRVVGTGWTSVVVATLPSDTWSTGTGSAARLLKALPTVRGGWGSGHLLRGRLFSAVLTQDGRLAVGAVAPSRLYAALAK
jgi:outer membrane lipoprotein-sorting protein